MSSSVFSTAEDEDDFHESLPCRSGTTTDEIIVPLGQGGTSGGWCLEFRKPPPDPLLEQGGGTSFSEEILKEIQERIGIAEDCAGIAFQDTFQNFGID